MKLRSIETFCNEFVGFVRITAEDGMQGWGQVATYNADITCQVLHRQVAPWTLGVDTTDCDDLLDLVTEREHKFPGSYLRRAIGGLDTAVWDLRGRLAEKPVAELLGGSAGPVRAYASSMKRDITPDDEAERLKRLRHEKGFDAFKVRAGAEVGRDRDEWPGRTEELIPKVRRALGPDVAILIDANSCYSPPKAIEIGRRLEDYGFGHFEEPCPYWELEQTKEVADALDIDIAGGEQDCDLPTWRRIFEMRAVDLPQPDVLYLGGVCRTMRVVRMAQEHGFTVLPHAANLSLVTLFTMHLLRAIPNPGKYLEFSIEGPDYYPWQEGLFTSDPFEIVDGRASVSQLPGWGVEINPEWLSRASYQISEL
ncbi:MAG: mandelate racemase/muconate lactonizing enzyme family protein [Pseudomonadota bacterium]